MEGGGRRHCGVPVVFVVGFFFVNSVLVNLTLIIYSYINHIIIY